ncbi:hypothetical protein Tco_0925287 [Tanacetum coccineum]|uniref:Uncharacterized protein n=1 Tax=Tanacetum coccineum TaxID=301880 RepID=A0ABQ5D799_9ASTR
MFGPNGGSGGKFEVGFEENVGSCGGNGGRGDSIVGRGRGSLAKRLMVSKDGLGGGGFVVLGRRSSRESKKECLDGWVGASGGEVNGGGDDFEVSRILLGDTPRVIIGEVVVRHLESIEDPIDNQWVVIEHDKEGKNFEGWRSNKDGHLS